MTLIKDDKLPELLDSKAAMLSKVTQSQLYKLAFGEDEGIENLSFDVVWSVAVSIAEHLEFDENWMEDEQASNRIFQYYIPLALWLYQQVQIGKKVYYETTQD